MAFSKNKCVQANSAGCKLEVCLAPSPCEVWVPDDDAGLLPGYCKSCLSDGDCLQHRLFPATTALFTAMRTFPDGSGGGKAVAVTLALTEAVLFSLWSLQSVWCLCWIWQGKGSFWERGPRSLAPERRCAEAAAHLSACRKRLFSFFPLFSKAKISSQLSKVLQKSEINSYLHNKI